MKKPVGVLLVFLAAATIFLAVPFAAGAAPQFSGGFNFKDNRGPNTVGFSTGLKFNIGAYVLPDPPGDPVASVVADPDISGPDNPSYTLVPFPYPARPGLWTNDPPADYAGQYGGWRFTATSSASASSTMLTYPLLLPVITIPLAQNIVVTPNGTTPTISWDPVSPGPDIDTSSYQVTLMTARTDMFHVATVATSPTPSYTVPSGVLSPGQAYTARIRAVYATPTEGAWQSVSSAFENFVTNTFFIDDGNGLIYDPDLNITWLQDANYAMTSGYDADGLMTSSAANTWATTLVYGGTGGWRLPTFDPSNPRPVSPTSLNEIGSLRTRLAGGANNNLFYPHDFSPFVNIRYLSLPQPPPNNSDDYWTGLENGAGGLWRILLTCG